MVLDARNEVTKPEGRKPVAHVIGAAVHHSVSGDYFNESTSEEAERNHIRTIDRYHASIGYGLFGYHMATFPSGRVYLCGELNGQRAHVFQRNHELVGIVAIGTFTDKLPGASQMQAIVEGLRYMWSYFGRELTIKGHTSWSVPGGETGCPGRLDTVDWYKLVKEENELANISGDGSQRIVSEGTFTVLYNQNVPVFRWGSTDGQYPGRMSKNFGGTWWWMRTLSDEGNFVPIHFSLIEGD